MCTDGSSSSLKNSREKHKERKNAWPSLFATWQGETSIEEGS